MLAHLEAIRRSLIEHYPMHKRRANIRSRAMELEHRLGKRWLIWTSSSRQLLYAKTGQ